MVSLMLREVKRNNSPQVITGTYDQVIAWLDNIKDIDVTDIAFTLIFDNEADRDTYYASSTYKWAAWKVGTTVSEPITL